MPDTSDLEAVIRSRVEQGRFVIQRPDPSHVMEDLRRTDVPWGRLAEEARRIIAVYGDFEIVVGEAQYHYEQAAPARPRTPTGSPRPAYDITSHVYRWAQADADDYDQDACEIVRVFDGVDIRIAPPGGNRR